MCLLAWLQWFCHNLFDCVSSVDNIYSLWCLPCSRISSPSLLSWLLMHLIKMYKMRSYIGIQFCLCMKKEGRASPSVERHSLLFHTFKKELRLGCSFVFQYERLWFLKVVVIELCSLFKLQSTVRLALSGEHSSLKEVWRKWADLCLTFSCW